MWITSTNILHSILNSREYNQAKFELEVISNEIKYCAYSECFYIAKEILHKNQFIIISGKPGIGKTTLARMLVFDALAEGYEDFIYITENIEEAIKLYSPDKKQIFFYDDFLGSNFLNRNLEKNEEKNIITFIRKIQNEPNKLLILTTREYILQQAENIYPILSEKINNTSKYILDISEYSYLIRAEILYNHLFFSSIPLEFIESILSNNNYIRIIEHNNYTPRIISSLCQGSIRNTINPDDFFNTFIKALDDLYSIWENIFENQISEIARITLLFIALSETSILIEDVELSTFNYFGEKYPIRSFNNVIKEIEGTFIKTEIDKDGVIAIGLENPSIKDFLIKYLHSNHLVVKKILSRISFMNQAFDVFELKKDSDYGIRLVRPFEPIIHTDDTIKSLKEGLDSHIENIWSSTKIYKKQQDNSFAWIKIDQDRLRWLLKISEIYDLKEDCTFRRYLIQYLQKIEASSMSVDSNILDYIDLTLRVNLDVDYEQFVLEKSTDINSFEQLYYFCELSYRLPSQFISLLETEKGEKIIIQAMDLCESEFLKVFHISMNSQTHLFARFISKAEMERVCEEINDISRILKLGIWLDSDYHKEYVRSKLIEKAKEEGTYSTDINSTNKDQDVDKTREIVHDLFSSLRNK